MRDASDVFLGAALGLVISAFLWQNVAVGALEASNVAIVLSVILHAFAPPAPIARHVAPLPESLAIHTTPGTRASTLAPCIAVSAQPTESSRTMATLVEDLDIFKAVLEDIAAFAAGKAVSTTQTIGSTTFTAAVQVLPSGPVAPYQTFSGGFLAILSLVLESYVAFSAGQPIHIAEKIGNTWYGTSITLVAKTAIFATHSLSDFRW